MCAVTQQTTAMVHLVGCARAEQNLLQGKQPIQTDLGYPVDYLSVTNSIPHPN